MKRLGNTVFALVGLATVSLALNACGTSTSIPANAVANVDGTPITKVDYLKWATITAKGSAQGGVAVVPDPPTYARCIAALRKQTRVRRGQPKPSEATLRSQCQTQNTAMMQQAMSTLIQERWIEKEADNQDVSVTKGEVERQLATTKRESFPNEAAYQRFLKQTGMTAADVLERIRVQALATKITRKIEDSSGSVSSTQVSSYYNRNKTQFTVPERRDVQMILTRGQAKAKAAKAAVQGGTSWAAVAKKYSTDAASKATGGEIKGIAKGQRDRAFDQAAFTAKKGVLVGPVKGQFGWYLVRVAAITPGRQTSLNEARAQIRAILQQQGSQQKMASFVRDFQKRWRSKTNCRTGYIVELCSNAPKPRTSSTAAPTTR